MRTNKKILLTILLGFIFIGQVIGQVVEQNSDEQHRQAACDEYWNGLASNINKHETYKDREEYLQTVKSQLLHNNNDGLVILEDFASEYMPNTFAKYEKAREKSLELGQNLKEVFNEKVDSTSPLWSRYLSATEKYAAILVEELRLQNDITYYYLFYKVDAITTEKLEKIDSKKICVYLEKGNSHNLDYKEKKIDGVMEFASNYMPETHFLLEEFEKEIRETKVQYDSIMSETEKMFYFKNNTTHPVFLVFEDKYKSLIQVYNKLMRKVKELQLDYQLQDCTGEDLAVIDTDLRETHEEFRKSLPEFVKNGAGIELKNNIEKIITSMVKIPNKNYLIGMTEVTQAQWQEIMGNNPSHFKGDLSRPVESVSWNDCQEFIKKLNARTEVKKAGITFRLPTSEEWEYACRAGSKGKYGLLPYGREGTIDEMGWYKDNSDGKTHPVGQKKPNAWGLYDMHGNVWEWTDSANGESRFYRGGCYCFDAFCCVSYFRTLNNLDYRHSSLGFRLAADWTEK